MTEQVHAAPPVGTGGPSAFPNIIQGPVRYSITIAPGTKQKEEKTAAACGAAVWRPVVKFPEVLLPRDEVEPAEAAPSKPNVMATLNLKSIQKIYPHSGDQKKSKQKKGEPEKKTNLQVTEQGVIAVQQFNLDIADKEFIVLVGPSGCGKSTTLRMVAGLEEISGGELYIDNKLMNDVEPKNRDIAMVFQSYALYPHMTVYENMAFPLKLRKMDKDEIDRRVKEAAEILDITQYLDRKPKALSGGQRQRVAIGRAIVREPKVLLMDEPLSNLDAKLRNQMRAEIIKLRQKINTTFIYVTHDQTEAMTLGDRIVIMKDGYLQQIGTPQEVFDHPANLFVAGFIGMPQMNFFNAKLVNEGGKYAVSVGGCKVVLSDEKQKNLAAHNVAAQDITLGVRPSHMILSKEPANTLSAVIEVSELMGSEVHFHANADGKDVVVIVPTMDANGERIDSFHSGDKLNLTFSGNVCHVFAKDGKNLEF